MPEIIVTLPGTIRIKKNSRRPVQIGGVNKPRRLVILPSAGYVKWEKEARKDVENQLDGWQIKGRPLIDPAASISVKVLAYIQGQMPDLSGILESVGDCLEGIIWEDDKQIKSWDGSRVFRVDEVGRARTDVLIVW
jgi:Holliday junction resolvase RusA-like endonuclease